MSNRLNIKVSEGATDWAASVTGAFADQFSFPIFCKDPQNDFAYTVWNRACEERTGLSAANVIGKVDSAFMPRETAKEMKLLDEEVIRRREVFYIPDERVTTTSGDVIILRVWKVPLYAADGTPTLLVCICQDMTENSEATDIIHKQRIKLLQTARLAALGEMAGGIAHEINTPLSTILLSAEAALDAVTAGDQIDAKASLDSIVTSVERIKKIVIGMRLICRDASSDPLQQVKLDEVIEESVSLCGQRIKTKGIKVSVRGEKGVVVLGKQAELCQVFFNLLTNACDAVSENRSASIEIVITQISKEIQIAVQDNGPGVSQAVRSKIFNPFFSTKSDAHGAGLGLTVSQQIMKNHLGNVSLEESESGALFVITLPRM